VQDPEFKPQYCQKKNLPWEENEHANEADVGLLE
jgi:hypothetical protein